MVENLHVDPLFCGQSVSICDVRCRPHGAQPKGDEWASAYEVVFPRVGVFVKHVGSRSHVADSTQVLFLNRRAPYRVSHPDSGGDDCTVFTFSSDVLRDAIAPYDAAVRERPDRLFRFGHGPFDPAAAQFLHKLRQYVRDPSCDGITVDEVAFQLLESIIHATYRVRAHRPMRKRADTLSVHKDLTDATKMILASRLRSRLSLDDIARAVHCSSFHLARLFRSQVGHPIHAHRNRLRLGASLERLAEGESNLTKLALELGYSSHSHFSASFRRQFGMSPSEFRATATIAHVRQMSKNLTA